MGLLLILFSVGQDQLSGHLVAILVVNLHEFRLWANLTGTAVDGGIDACINARHVVLLRQIPRQSRRRQVQQIRRAYGQELGRRGFAG